jgi:hypothetical protein
VWLSTGFIGQPGLAATNAGPPMTVRVASRSGAAGFGGPALVYLDGQIDPGAPDRLAKALEGIEGRIAIWLNSPGGNLFAGMQLGRLIREHGAWTYIVDFRTLLPGECYSACALAFLGGVQRFNDHGARYGVHQASLRVDGANGLRDLGADLAGAVGSYMREMGVDARLLDLWRNAAPHEMYVLSPREARDLRVVNDGRAPPEWQITPFPGGNMLQGRQTTAAGEATVFFSCDDTQATFGSVYPVAGKSAPADVRSWAHVLTIDGDEAGPLRAVGVSSRDGFVRSTFTLPLGLVRRAMSAQRIGHRMKPSSRAPSIDVGVDVDEGSALMVRTFLANCLRRQVE